MRSIGYQWLITHLGLPAYPLPVRSMLGARLSSQPSSDQALLQVFPASYDRAEPLGHLEFALKHEGINLPVLSAALKAIGPAAIEARVHASPASKYARLLGFYYEFCTGEALHITTFIGGNYVDALDEDRYLTGHRHANSRWRVHNNLLGSPAFCPTIRRIEGIPEAMSKNLRLDIDHLVATLPPELLERAAHALALGETKATYGLEHEDMPAHDRRARFLRLLHSAGLRDLTTLFSEPALTECQRLVLDPRYAENGFRHSQNYVGQTLAYQEHLHYICPPPEQVSSLLEGLRDFALQQSHLHPVIHAGVVAFGFVFVHPFEDGNGRLHRFLIHDMLQRRGMVPPGVLLPLSALMLRERKQYDAALEGFSKPLMALAQYELHPDGHLDFHNGEALQDYYRYPDMTEIVMYLAKVVERCIHEDFADEIRHFMALVNAREAIRQIVDMPDRHLDFLLSCLLQNKGRLSARKRPKFAELSDAEVSAIEAVFKLAFPDLPCARQVRRKRLRHD